MAAYYEMLIDAGATWTGLIEWQDSEETVIPLTGYSARMMLKSTYADTAALVSLTSEVGGGLTIDEEAGTIAISISDTDTASLCTTVPTEGVYDLEIESGTGVITRILGGPWYANPQATV